MDVAKYSDEPSERVLEKGRRQGASREYDESTWSGQEYINTKLWLGKYRGNTCLFGRFVRNYPPTFIFNKLKYAVRWLKFHHINEFDDCGTRSGCLLR